MQLLQQMAIRTAFYIAVIFGLPGLGNAAPTGSETAKIQLIAFAYNGSEHELTIADEKGAPMSEKPVAFPIYQCTEPISVSSRNLVFLFGQSPKEQDGQGPNRKEPKSDSIVKKANVSLPATGRDFVLVFLPEGASYRVHAVELPTEKFKGGSYAFLNFSNAEIGCMFDKQKVGVTPGKAGIMSPDAKNGMIFVACYEKEKDGWSAYPFFSSRVPIQPKVRSLVLMSRDPRSGHLDFRAVADFVK